MTILDEMLKNIQVVGEVDNECWNRSESFWGSKEISDAKLDNYYKYYGFKTTFTADTLLSNIKLHELGYLTRNIKDKQKFLDMCCSIIIANEDATAFNKWANDTYKFDKCTVLLDTTTLENGIVTVYGAFYNN